MGKRVADMTPEEHELCKAKVRAWQAAYPEKVKAWKAANPEKLRSHKRKQLYGISKNEYQAMLLVQGGVCLICGGTQKNGDSLAVDHCHKTGKVRGLLCHSCNHAIGKLKDDPMLALAVWAYLRQPEEKLHVA